MTKQKHAPIKVTKAMKEALRWMANNGGKCVRPKLKFGGNVMCANGEIAHHRYQTFIKCERLGLIERNEGRRFCITKNGWVMMAGVASDAAITAPAP